MKKNETEPPSFPQRDMRPDTLSSFSRRSVFMAVGILFSLAVNAMAEPIGAKAVYVEGKVSVISAADQAMRDVKVGSTFAEGDRIKTSFNGVVEVEFDTGDLIRVDRGTDLVVKSLHRDNSGSTFSIFGLMIGRVKSAVSKLVSSASKFEYHTKAALCGVSGTPPFIVETTGQTTNVDLLGQPGERGAVYVRGFDPAQSMVTIFSGMRTTVNAGMAPSTPFPISQDRMRSLNKLMPFVTPIKTKEPSAQAPATQPEKAQEKKEPEIAAKPEPRKTEPAVTAPTPSTPTGVNNTLAGAQESMTLNALSRSVSAPVQPAPSEVNSAKSVESQTQPQQGAIGQQTTSSGTVEAPPSVTSVNIRIRLK